MKKFILDLTVTENLKLHANYALLKLASQSPLPEMLPGQFAEIRVDGSPTTFLRRPISINYVDRQRNEVWFLIQLVGDGTRRLAEVANGEIINVVLPLGNGFTMPENPPSSWEHELIKICFSWMSLQLTEKYIRLPKTEVTEKKDMSPNIPY